MKPDCYQCKHVRSIPGDVHKHCVHPEVASRQLGILPALVSQSRLSSLWQRLGIEADVFGMKHGWFLWPINFDPTWLLNCNGYEPKEGPEGPHRKD